MKLKRKILSLVMTAAMITTLFAGLTISASAYTATGTMSSLKTTTGFNTAATNGIYSISSATELEYLQEYVDGGYATSGRTFYLTQNITLSGSWTPIGNNATITSSSATNNSPAASGTGFAGTFDGQNFKVSGLSITSGGSGAGLFKYVTSTGTVKKLVVEGSVTASNGDAIAGVVGYNSGTIDQVTNKATVTGNGCYNVGGIAGFNDAIYTTNAVGVIKNCVNTGNITGKSKVGGIVGENAGLVSSCNNTGTITSTNGGKDGIGGIAGRNGNNNTAVETGIIRNCYNTGTVSDSNGKWVGGITGFQNSLSSVVNCYSTGTISGVGFCNNIVGKNEGTTTNAYGSQTNGTGSTVDETGTIKTESYMITSSFLNNIKGSTTNIWQQAANQFPTLTMRAGETSAGDSSTVSNDEEIIYLSSVGNDSNAGTSEAPVATLGRAVALADASTATDVYVEVIDTITVSGTESVFGSSTNISWTGAENVSPMFIVTGTLTIGGLVIVGNSVSTMFQVNNGGTLTVRNNSSLSDCGTAIDVKAGGALTLNRSSITGTNYSVKLAAASGSTPAATCTMSVNTSAGQKIIINGTVYLGTGTYITTQSSPALMLTNTLNVTMQTPSGYPTIISGSGLTSSDKAKVNCTNGSVELAEDYSEIYLDIE